MLCSCCSMGLWGWGQGGKIREGKGEGVGVAAGFWILSTAFLSECCFVLCSDEIIMTTYVLNVVDGEDSLK